MSHALRHSACSIPSPQHRPFTSKRGIEGWVAVVLASSILAVFVAEDRSALTPANESSTMGQSNADRECAWQGGFELGGIDGWVWALAVFDDGGGPALYAAGLFAAAGKFKASNIARWDGSSWSTLSGPNGEGVTGLVYDLTVYDDGTGPALYAAGTFERAGGIPASRVARWDGKSWAALSDATFDSDVTSLQVFDRGDGPELYAGGHFATVGGVEANHIARWNGSTWSTLEGPTAIGLDSSVIALEVFDDGGGPDLYAGGFFTSAGGSPASFIARWDGTAWSALAGPTGEGAADYVLTLRTYDDGGGPDLYVGGIFLAAGGVPAARLARWDGTGWSAEGLGRGGAVYVMSTYDDGAELCVGAADFEKVTCWNGTTWKNLSGPAGSGVDRTVSALAEYDDGSGPALFVGGKFDVAGGLPSRSIARWRPSEWSNPGGLGKGLDQPTQAFASFRDPSGPALYAAGRFEVAGTEVVNNIARWDGASWSPLVDDAVPGTDSTVRALTAFDDGSGPALFAAGEFRQAGGRLADRIARWDGVSWSAIGGPTWNDADIFALAVYDDGTGAALYAGGLFITIDGVVMNSIARWDGVSWSPLTGPSGTGVNGYVYDLVTFDDGSGAALYATGWFIGAGGVDADYIARWDGATWSPLHGPSGAGIDDSGLALAVYDDGEGPRLHVGGSFTSADGITVNRVARWDGATWEAITGPHGTGTDGLVRSLAVYNDGSGPGLYAGGFFATAGGLPASGVARWDGKGWSALDTGVWDAYALKTWYGPHGPELLVGGSFRLAGDVPSSHVAAWNCGRVAVFADGFESGDTSAWSAGVP